MGEDKALLDFGGQPLIQQVLKRLDSLAPETIITTNHPEGYRFLGLPLISDIIPERGALGGLYTALSTASHPLVAVVACDMPFASSKIFATCRNLLLKDTKLDAVIPSTEYGLEPMHAVYRQETCLPAVKRAIDADKWKVISWHKDVNVRVLSPSEIAIHDQNDLAFWNLNTPKDFTTALRMIKKSAR